MVYVFVMLSVFLRSSDAARAIIGGGSKKLQAVDAVGLDNATQDDDARPRISKARRKNIKAKAEELRALLENYPGEAELDAAQNNTLKLEDYVMGVIEQNSRITAEELRAALENYPGETEKEVGAAQNHTLLLENYIMSVTEQNNLIEDELDELEDLVGESSLEEELIREAAARLEQMQALEKALETKDIEAIKAIEKKKIYWRKNRGFGTYQGYLEGGTHSDFKVALVKKADEMIIKLAQKALNDAVEERSVTKIGAIKKFISFDEELIKEADEMVRQLYEDAAAEALRDAMGEGLVMNIRNAIANLKLHNKDHPFIPKALERIDELVRQAREAAMHRQ